MSLAVLHSRALAGLHAPEVTVEVHLTNGLPNFTIVGLPEAEVKEARDRVRAAIINSRFEFPARRVTVNLAPADLPKESGRFDLAIALGILAASSQLSAKYLDRHEFAGELSLSGRLRPIRGALAFAIANVATAPTRAIVVPQENADEAALVTQATVLPACSLLAVCAHLGETASDRLTRHIAVACGQQPDIYPDFSDVKGQLAARRALEIAAAGGHSALMIGPPGTGKSMLAARLPGILPPLEENEALECAVVQSITTGFDLQRWRQRPFRSPHHTASGVALAGGGSKPRPGEMSLAHHGVLFLDELPEFGRHALEVLRQPLETGRITISRAARQCEFPARFMLLAAMNPCPCGYAGHPERECRCSPQEIKRYQGKLSGPLLDRIDMQIQISSISYQDLRDARPGETTTAIAQRVSRCRSLQLARQGCLNMLLSTAGMDAWCQPDARGEQLLNSAMRKFFWSARGYHRALKLARTIADLEGVEKISATHIAESIQYRRVLADK